jgi:hypothetical protein
MIDIDSMTPRELAAGLMRGDREDFKLGYSPRSAALAAAQRNELSEDDARKLLDWALGFHDGMHDAMHTSDPNVEGAPQRESFRENSDYLEGRGAGFRENGFRLYPTAVE